MASSESVLDVIPRHSIVPPQVTLKTRGLKMTFRAGRKKPEARWFICHDAPGNIVPHPGHQDGWLLAIYYKSGRWWGVFPGQDPFELLRGESIAPRGDIELVALEVRG